MTRNLSWIMITPIHVLSPISLSKQSTSRPFLFSSRVSPLKFFISHARLGFKLHPASCQTHVGPFGKVHYIQSVHRKEFCSDREEIGNHETLHACHTVVPMGSCEKKNEWKPRTQHRTQFRWEPFHTFTSVFNLRISTFV